MASTYSSWAYYSDDYHGTLAEAAYARLAVLAAGEIARRTFGRAATAPASMAWALKNCECELVDVLSAHAAAGQLLPGGISSINNDGLSVSADPEARKNLQAAEIRAVCQKWLLYPVNLLYLGVRRC